MTLYPKMGTTWWTADARQRGVQAVQVTTIEIDWTTGKVVCRRRTANGVEYIHKKPSGLYATKEDCQEVINRVTGKLPPKETGDQTKLEV